MSRRFESEGFQVVEADNGREALGHAIRGGIDIVVSDVLLPQMSGLELLEEMQRRGVTAPMILVSGDDNPETANEAMRQGALAYFGKPVDFERLLEILERKVCGGDDPEV